MVDRTAILWIGDETIRGSRPSTELAAINPSYTAAQTGLSKIWNIQAQAWQDTTPGTNTDTAYSASDKWGPEARARAALLTAKPTGRIDHIKFAITGSTLQFADLRRNPDGTAAGGTLKPCWHPLARDTAAYSGMIAQVRAAALAAAAGGDSLKIGAVAISIFATEAFLGVGWHNYASRIAELIETLYFDLQVSGLAPFAAIQDGFPMIPFVVAVPHGRFTGLTDSQKQVLVSLRTQLESIRSSTYRVSIVPTYDLTTTDGTNWDAASLVVLGERMALAMVPQAATTETGDEAGMVGVLGDSIFEGSGLAPFPTYLTGALSGVKTLTRDSGVFETMQIGVNVGISNAPATSIMDVAVPLSVMHRAEEPSGEVWVVKTTMIGSTASAVRERYLAPVGPLGDVFNRSWHPGVPESLADLAIARFTNAAEILRKIGRKPRMRTVYVCLGSNDVIIQGTLHETDLPAEAVPAMKSLKRRFDKLFRDLGIGSSVSWVFALPSSVLAKTAPWTGTRVEDLRSELQSWAMEDPSVRVADLTDIATVDGLHPSTAGTLVLAPRLFEAYQTAQNSVRPLFVADRATLTKALRLSQVRSTNDASSQIDEAIRVARTKLYQALGATRVEQVLALATKASPVSADDYTRATANTVETKMVRRELLRVMPLMFMDGANPVQSWNEEAAFREGGYVLIQKELARLEEDINSGLTILLSGTVGSSQVETLMPDTFHNPGDSIFEVI